MMVTPMSGLLTELAQSSLARLEQARARESEQMLWTRVCSAPQAPRLKLSAEGFDIIAECKLASPSAGDLSAHTTDIDRRVQAYAHGGACAVSVLTEPSRFGGSLALVFADLDWFKDVNDRHGHPSGDAVLREFAAVLQETVRDVDLAGRWGGEEFLLILPGTDLSGGAQVAERIRVALAGRIVLTSAGTPIPVTASFGVAATPPATTAAELFSAADAALYEAKRNGKNRVETAPEAVPHP